MRRKYRGAFKIGHTVMVLYVYATSEKQAAARLLRRLAIADGVPVGTVKEAVTYTIQEEPDANQNG